MPKISVIIPVYNVEKFLPRCLDSILNQTFEDFEIVCVDDGSSDKSLFILIEYAKKDKRIKVIAQENQGCSIVRNKGVVKSVGEYVCFVDSDDAIHPQCLELAYLLAERNKADVVNYHYKDVCLGNDENLFRKKFDINRLDVKITDRPVFFGTHRENYRVDFSACCKLYKKKILDGIEFIPNITMEDYPHTYAVLSKSPKTVLINDVFYFYTINEDSTVHKSGKPQTIKDYHTGIKYIYEIYKQTGLEEELNFIIKNFIPNILNQQLGRCRHASKEMQSLMYKAFAEELRDLDDKKLLRWSDYRVIKCWVYAKYNS